MHNWLQVFACMKWKSHFHSKFDRTILAEIIDYKM